MVPPIGNAKPRPPLSPVPPGDATTAVLQATFGRAPDGRLWRGGWLLWLAAGGQGDEVAPRRFADPVAPVFRLAGEVDDVRRVAGPAERWDLGLVGGMVREAPRPRPDRMRLEMSWRAEATMAELFRAADDRGLPGRPFGCGPQRYLALVADRYDQDGLRVERAVAERAQLGLADWCTEWVSADVEATGALRWWSTAAHNAPLAGRPGWTAA